MPDRRRSPVLLQIPLSVQVGTYRGGPGVRVYVVAQISIHDRARYDRYVAQFMRVLAGFDGRLLAADESPAVVEGTWPYQKVILLEFPDRSAFERWGYSPEYTEIARDRIAATTGCVLLVSGIASEGSP
jgi:uncharacterized protein (DUF1330 family)